jgi:hypothetical protein
MNEYKRRCPSLIAGFKCDLSIDHLGEEFLLTFGKDFDPLLPCRLRGQASRHPPYRSKTEQAHVSYAK